MSDINLELQVTKQLQRLGSPSHLLGYRMLRAAVVYMYNAGDAKVSMTGELYPAVAKQFGSAPTRVERAIRHLMEHLNANGNRDEMERLGFFENWTNSHVIMRLVEELRMGDHGEPMPQPKQLQPSRRPSLSQLIEQASIILNEIQERVNRREVVQVELD